MTTAKGELEFGIEHNGVVHYDVEMRMFTIDDNVTAIETVGTDSGIKITLAMLVRSIVKLGTIPREQITYDLLVNGLADTDYDRLVSLQNDIKKKRRRTKTGSAATASSSSSSASTVSANPTSAP